MLFYALRRHVWMASIACIIGCEAEPSKPAGETLLPIKTSQEPDTWREKTARTETQHRGAEDAATRSIPVNSGVQPKGAEGQAEHSESEKQATKLEKGREQRTTLQAKMGAMKAAEVERAAVLGIISQNLCMRKAELGPKLIRRVQADVLASFQLTVPSFNAARARYKTDPEFRKALIIAQKNCPIDSSVYGVMKDKPQSKHALSTTATKFNETVVNGLLKGRFFGSLGGTLECTVAGETIQGNIAFNNGSRAPVQGWVKGRDFLLAGLPREDGKTFQAKGTFLGGGHGGWAAWQSAQDGTLRSGTLLLHR